MFEHPDLTIIIINTLKEWIKIASKIDTQYRELNTN